MIGDRLMWVTVSGFHFGSQESFGNNNEAYFSFLLLLLFCFLVIVVAGDGVK